jgi:hypothetical protein
MRGTNSAENDCAAPTRDVHTLRLRGGAVVQNNHGVQRAPHTVAHRSLTARSPPTADWIAGRFVKSVIDRALKWQQSPALTWGDALETVRTVRKKTSKAPGRNTHTCA